MAKRSDKDEGATTRGKSSGGADRRGGAPSRGAKPGARVEKPRIKVTHSEGTSSPPAAGKKRRPAGSRGGALGADEIEKRSARARATVRSLGGRTATSPKPKAAAPKPQLPVAARGPGPRKRSIPPGAAPSDEARRRAIAIAAAGLDKKAIGVEVLDVTGRVDYADFLVIMTGTSDRHVHAIAMGIEEELKRIKVHALSVEGLQTASWVLMDFDDVVVHVFQEETRRLYDIEGLWMDASRVAVEGAPHDQPTA